MVHMQLVKNQYENIHCFLNDMQLIWDKYETFNLNGSDIYVVEIECEDAFHKHFAKMFKINLVYNEDYPIYREHNVLGVNEEMEVEKVNYPAMAE